MKPSELSQLLAKTIPVGLPVCISGPPGGGKTEISKQASVDAEHQIIITHPVIKNPTSYEGLGAITRDEGGKPQAEFLPYGDMRAMTEATEPTVVIIDDMGQAPQSVQAALMQVILERAINGIKVSEYVTFIACTNRRQDKSGVNPILRALLTRFATVVNLEPDVTDWSNWAHQNDVTPELIFFINYRPDYLLRPPEVIRELENYPNPRTVFQMHKLIQLGLSEELEMEVYTGAVGAAMATEYLAFRRIYLDLPNPLLMLQDPHSVALPKDIGTLYAMLAALTDKVEQDTAGGFFVLMDRLAKEKKYEGGPELSTTGIQGLLVRKPWVMKHQAYTKWAITTGQHLF